MENNTSVQKSQFKIIINEEQQLKNQQQLVYSQQQNLQRQPQNSQNKQEINRRCLNIQIIDKERRLSIPVLNISKSPLLNRRFNENNSSSQHSFRDTERKIMQMQMVEVNRSISVDILQEPNFRRSRSQSKYVTEVSKRNVQESIIKKEEEEKKIKQKFKTFHLFKFFTNEIFIVSILVLIVILFQNMYMNAKN